MIPYEFTGPYAECFTHPGNQLDRRHIYLIYEILCYRGFFNSALEIGSFWGATTTAFVEAMKKTKMHVSTCDIHPTESAVNVVRNAPDASRIKTYPQSSRVVLGLPVDFDFVMVDGYHDLANVKPEVEHLLRRKPRCIMAHDTNATASGRPKCEGAAYLKQTFQLHPHYHCLEDSALRIGESTERGLFLATTSLGLLNRAKESFRKWCIEYQPEICFA